MIVIGAVNAAAKPLIDWSSPSRRSRTCSQRPWIKPPERQALAREVAQRAGLGKLVQDFVSLVAARGRSDHMRETPRPTAR